MTAPKWSGAMYATELKRLFSYRVDFWVQFFVAITVEISVAYFLWEAVYKVQNVTEIGGYTLPMMILYSVFAVFAGRIVRGNERIIIASDIYDGSITKYLLYPVNYFIVNLSLAFAYDTVSVTQMFLGLGLLFLVFGLPPEYSFSWQNIVMGTTACLTASVFYFIIYVMIDYLAFWVDTIWGLSVMYRFIAQFLSGLFIPLELFPRSFRHFVYMTPFPYIGSEPVKMFLGRSSWAQWAHTNLVILLWTVPLFVVMRIVWYRGVRNYSGVGI